MHLTDAVGPIALPHIREVRLPASSIDEEASGHGQARCKNRHIGKAISIQANMADLAEAVVGPVEPPLQRIDAKRLRLINSILVLDEIAVLAHRAPRLPRDNVLIVISKVDFRWLHRGVHRNAPTLWVIVAAVEGQELLHNTAITRQARALNP